MIDIVYWGDDWIALYHNNKKVLEGHNFYPSDVAKVLGFEVTVHTIKPDTEEELWDGPPEFFIKNDQTPQTQTTP